MRQIVYFSTASARQDRSIVAQILASSRRNNDRDGITGILVASGHRYLQVIEGPDGSMDDLVSRLRRDDRHVGMTILTDRAVLAPDFPDWSMAFAQEPRIDEFATFGELVGLLRAQLDKPGAQRGANRSGDCRAASSIIERAARLHSDARLH